MAILCDVCNTDVTPREGLLGEEMTMHEVINLNGKICLCHDCFCALAEFVRSKEFLEVRGKYLEEIKAQQM